MNYAIETLQKEADLLEKCLSEWECKNHPEAKKEREKKLNDLYIAIKMVVRGNIPLIM